MMSEEDYLLDQAYADIDKIVNSAKDEYEALCGLLESEYFITIDEAYKLIKRFRKRAFERGEHEE